MESDQNCAVRQTQRQPSSVDENDAGSREGPSTVDQPLSPSDSANRDSDDTDSSTSSDSEVESPPVGQGLLASMATELSRLFASFRCRVGAEDGRRCAVSRPLQRVLAQWARDENVADDALTVLLEILRDHHCAHLPADAQTLHYIVDNVDDDVAQNESEE